MPPRSPGDHDVLVGVSGGTIGEPAVAAMAPGGIVFALADPNPEVHPEVAATSLDPRVAPAVAAAVAAAGRDGVARAAT
jgi:hypothetical protein